MTKVMFFRKNNILLGYEASGHTGYGKHGDDIVCSALSSIIQSTSLGLSEVLGIEVKIDRDDDRGYFKVVLPEKMEQKKLEESQILLNTLLISVKDLADNYSKYIKLEERDDVY